MQDFLTRIWALVTSLEFIVGTLICGLVLSIAGAALYDWGKVLLGRVSARQRERNKEEKEGIEYLGRLCAQNPSYLSIRVSDAAWFQIEANAIIICVGLLLLIVILLTSAINPSWGVKFWDLDFRSPSTIPPFDPLLMTKIPITAGRFWVRLFMLLVTIFALYQAFLAYRYRNLSKYNLRIISHARILIRKELEASIKNDQNDQ